MEALTSNERNILGKVQSEHSELLQFSCHSPQKFPPENVVSCSFSTNIISQI